MIMSTGMAERATVLDRWSRTIPSMAGCRPRVSNSSRWSPRKRVASRTCARRSSCSLTTILKPDVSCTSRFILLPGRRRSPRRQILHALNDRSGKISSETRSRPCTLRTQPGMPPPRRLTCHRPPRPEVDGAVATALQLTHQVVNGADRRLELRRADADEAHQVRVAAPVGLVTVAADQLLDPLVLALPAAAADRLDGDHALQRRLGLVVCAEPDGRPPGMAGQRDAAQAGDLADQLLRGQADVPEVEAGEDVLVHAVDEHVPVVGLDLGGGEDEEAVAVLQRAVVAARVELAVLGEHDAVERALRALALEELQVRLDGSPAVVGELGVEVQIEDHYTGRNFASVISAVTSSNTTSTAMPTRTASGAQPTTFVIMRTPSSSSTIAST